MTVEKLVFAFVFADDVVVGGEVGASNDPVFCRRSAVCDQLLVGFLEGGV